MPYLLTAKDTPFLCHNCGVLVAGEGDPEPDPYLGHPDESDFDEEMTAPVCLCGKCANEDLLTLDHEDCGLVHIIPVAKW